MLKVIGGEQEGEFKAVASGTLPNGKPVVVNSDGTVSVVEETSYSESLSSGTVYNTSNTIRIAAGFDSVNNKVIIAYHNVATSTGYAIVGTVSGDTISFGTHVQFENAAVEDITISVDTANDKVVIFYRDNGNSNYGTAIVGTVSGTSISFGTPTVYSSYYSQYNSSVYDTTSGKVIVANRDGSVTDDGLAYVGTVSGTGISFGSAQTFDNGSVGRVALVYDASVDRVVVVYKTGGTVNTKVGTVSGSTISFGSIQDHGGANIDKVEATGDNNGTIFICYNSGNSGSQASAFLATIGTSSITKGTTVNFDTEVPEMAPIYDSAFDKYVILYRINSPSNAGLYIVGSASGTTLTFESPVTYYNDNAEDVEIAFDSNSNKVVFVYRDSGDGGKGTARVFQNAGSLTNLTAENYIGMSSGVAFQTGSAASAGTPVVFEAATTNNIGAAFDPDNNKVVIAYRDDGNSEYGTAIVGTVNNSDNSITFGTPTVFESARSDHNEVTYDTSNDKIVIAYGDNGNSNRGTSVVGTVSGTSISFGSPTIFETGAIDWPSIIFDSTNNKVVVAYSTTSNSDGKAIVGTVSGTSISFGSAATFDTGSMQYIAAAYDSNAQKVVIAYAENSGSTGDAIVGTVSGTSISFGSAATFEGGAIGHVSIAYDETNNKVVIVYKDNGNSNYGTAIVGTVSGTSISFGTAAVFNEANTTYTSIVYDSSVQKLVISYKDGGDSSKGKVLGGTVSGTDITFDTAITFEDGLTNYIANVYDSNAQRTVIAYGDDSNSTHGTAAVYEANSIATTRGEVADGDPARVDIIGAESTIQIGLTAGEKYYVQTDGTLSTTADDPSVLAGTAISATKLVVKT